MHDFLKLSFKTGHLKDGILNVSKKPIAAK